MALTLATNIGQTGLRFVTVVSGAGAGSVVRVVRGNARVGSAGLIIDRMVTGVMEITLREVFAAGGFADTNFTIYGLEQMPAANAPIAIAGKGLTDAQARTAVSNAATTYTGLKAIGIAR